ncbi:hypothetical protein VNO77_02564 [Canavalia gladiata]|uniref:Uncharacterized protein n=1 Tax=Canavalia gladiata TaxID=3824 RepID=A0AAN9RBE4_CANGL
MDPMQSFMQANSITLTRGVGLEKKQVESTLCIPQSALRIGIFQTDSEGLLFRADHIEEAIVKKAIIGTSAIE